MRVVTTFLVIVSFFSCLTLPANAFDLGPGIAQQAWSMYKEMLRTDPLLTKSLTSGTINTVSDAICQKIVAVQKPSQEKDKNSSNADAEKFKLDGIRLLQVAITGMVWSGPIQHWWFGTLEKLVTIQDPIQRLMVKLLFDSMVFSPLTISGYFTCRSILEGSGIQGVREKLSTRFVSTLKGAWKFWPMVNILNYSLVPLQFRSLYSNILSLFWTGYLSFVNSKKMSRT
jgi:hypothetical protein